MTEEKDSLYEEFLELEEHLSWNLYREDEHSYDSNEE